MFPLCLLPTELVLRCVLVSDECKVGCDLRSSVSRCMRDWHLGVRGMVHPFPPHLRLDSNIRYVPQTQVPLSWSCSVYRLSVLHQHQVFWMPRAWKYFLVSSRQTGSLVLVFRLIWVPLFLDIHFPKLIDFISWEVLGLQKGFPGGSVVKNPPANSGNKGSIPGLGRSPGGGHGTPL